MQYFLYRIVRNVTAASLICCGPVYGVAATPTDSPLVLQNNITALVNHIEATLPKELWLTSLVIKDNGRHFELMGKAKNLAAVDHFSEGINLKFTSNAIQAIKAAVHKIKKSKKNLFDFEIRGSCTLLPNAVISHNDERLLISPEEVLHLTAVRSRQSGVQIQDVSTISTHNTRVLGLVAKTVKMTTIGSYRNQIGFIYALMHAPAGLELRSLFIKPAATAEGQTEATLEIASHHWKDAEKEQAPVDLPIAH